MVYKNGGVSAKTEKWTYGGKALEVVTYFTYLGLSFMANEQAIKGKRILVSILAKRYKYRQISNEFLFFVCLFLIFDT